MLLFSVIATAVFWRQQRALVEQRYQERVRAMAIALDRQIDGYVATLNALANAPELDGDDRAVRWIRAAAAEPPLSLRRDQNRIIVARTLNHDRSVGRRPARSLDENAAKFAPAGGGRVDITVERRGQHARIVDLPLMAVRLPISDGGQRGGTDLAGDRAPRLDGVRVLVVEDHPDSRELIKVVLEGRGAQCAAVGSVPEAIAPSPTPAVALSAYVSAEDRERALSVGFNRHLAKPIEPQELVGVVAEVCGLS